MNKAIKFLILSILLFSYLNTAADCINGTRSVCPGQTETYTLNPGEFSKASYSFPGGTKVAGGSFTANYITILWNTQGWHTLFVEELDPNLPSNSCSIEINVRAVAGGSVSSPSADICQGSSITLTLSGYSGSIQRWEKTTDGSSWQPISHTAPIYNTGALSLTTSYRALVNDCSGDAYSTPRMVTVEAPNPGNVSISAGSVSFCTGETASGTVLVSDYSGVVLAWEKSEYSGGSWGDWSSVSELHDVDCYDFSVSVPTRYRARIASGVCGALYSQTVEIYDTTPTVAGSISGPVVVCSGATFSLALNGNTGEVQGWYMRDEQHEYAELLGTPTNISITSPHYFKAVVRNGSCTPAETELYIAVKPPLFLSLSPDYQEICLDDQVNFYLVESPGLPVKWQRKNEGSDNWITVAENIQSKYFSFSPVNNSGQWQAVVANECEVVASNIGEVEVLDAIVSPQTSNVFICPGEVAVLSVNNPQPLPFRYVWYAYTNGQYIEKQLTASNEYRLSDISATATYYVAFERLGCVGPKSPIQVTIYNEVQTPAAPYIDVTTSPVYNVKIYKNNPSAGDITYYWQTQLDGKSTSNAVNVIDMPVSELYYVKAKNSLGCWSASSEPVEVINQLPPQIQYSAANINYVRTYNFQQPSTVTAYPADRDTENDPDKISVSTTYFDGMGRPVQNVIKKGSPSENDLITPIEYDEAGRMLRDHLPYVSTSGNGELKINPFPDQRNFYGNTQKIAESYFPFAYQKLERSPLDRPEASFSPGEDWVGHAGDNDSKRIEHHYLSNTSSDNVRLWQLDANGLPSASTSYAPGALVLSETYDEHGFKTKEFKTKENAVVLKRIQADVNTWAETYYIYDDFGNLVVVLPPEAVKVLSGN